jgi:hypothetical protein
MTHFDEDLPADEIPETIPGVIKVRKEIVRDIRRINTQFEKAEGAYNKQEFYTALKEYIDVLNKRVEIYSAIKRYDAGLSQTDQDTTQHLTTPDTLISRLKQQIPELDEHYIEASRVAERAKGLEVLINDIDTKCANINRIIRSGDSKKSRGEKDDAREKYTEARDRLEEIDEEIKIYEELRNMYDQKIVDTHQRSSANKYEEMKSDVKSKLETLDDSKSIHTISENALGGFDPEILTGTGVTLVDQELIDYLGDDEELNFVFIHKKKGFRIISDDGGEKTPHHSSRQNRVLLVTDQRILYVAPMGDYDKTLDFTYEEVTDVTTSTGLTSRTLQFTTDDGVKYRFADSGNRMRDLEPAANYIRSRIN